MLSRKISGVMPPVGKDLPRPARNQPASWYAATPKALCAAVVLIFGAMQAAAQHVGNCEGSSVGPILADLSPDAFVPFAKGAIRVADLYADANLASSVVVVVLHPRQSDLKDAGYYEACSVVYSTRTLSPYFGQVYLRRATAQYDAATGLTLTIPVRYDYVDRGSEDGSLTLTINQALGTVIAQER